MIVDIKGVGQAKFPDNMDKNSIRQFLRNKYFQDTVVGGQSDALTPLPNTIEARNPSLSEKISGGIAQGLTSTGLISDNARAQQIGKNITSIGEFLPVIGDATAGDEFGAAAAKGDKFGMAMAGLGVIPVAGDLAKKGVKKLYHGTDSIFDAFDDGKLGSAWGNKYDYGVGHYLTADKDYADVYAKHAADKSGKAAKVLEFESLAKNPYVIDYDKAVEGGSIQPFWDDIPDGISSMDEATEYLKSQGYDSVNVIKNGELWQQSVFDAKNIKSTTQGLPMDEASRMARAKEQGFDVDKTFYHGTDVDIENIDKSKFGEATRAESARQGFWSASKPSTAESYANHAARDAKVGNLIEDSYKAADKGDWDKHDELQRMAEELEGESAAGKGQNIMPLYASSNVKKIDMEGADFMDEQEYINGEIKKAQKDGFDGVEFKRLIDDVGLVGQEADHLIVFDPKNIRSKFAKFDPKNKDSAKLLGGLGALGLGVGLTQQEKQEDTTN